MSRIVQFARQLNLPEEKLLGDWIVCIPGFTLEKYRRLQRSRLSILAAYCFGGQISHLLGLPFLSPFVNMDALGDDGRNFIRFLRNPRAYMEEPITFNRTAFQTELKFDYPIVALSDVEILWNHTRVNEFDLAVSKWNERKKRINWYNLFVTMSTESEEVLAEFDALPYGKKVCFVPFKSDLDSAWYINPKIKNADCFIRTVNLFSVGSPFYYDPFDMLLYGKKTPLIEM